MSEWNVVISDTASESDSAALREAVHEFNFEATGYRDGRALSCFLYDDGVLIAGIDGFSWGSYARIDYVWVTEAHRAKGLGTRLLAAAEDEARRRGCVTIVLDSHSFQAPGLYRKLGYRDIGTTIDTPRGYTQTLFQKALSSPPAERRADVTIVAGRQWPDDVERLLRDLPEWFGIEQSILDYVNGARTLPTTVALRGDVVVGVCVIRRHTSRAAEVELLAVARELHRGGVGRTLMQAVEAELRSNGVELLQVKTFGPSGDSEEYERTRAFYASIGFVPLEERTDIWGPENPYLISVKALR